MWHHTHDIVARGRIGYCPVHRVTSDPVSKLKRYASATWAEVWQVDKVGWATMNNIPMGRVRILKVSESIAERTRIKRERGWV